MMKNFLHAFLFLFILFSILINITFEFSFNDLANSLLIADGTKWCGKGNKASDCDDFGEYKETDMCCREHDMCPYVFSTNEPNYNGFSLPGFHTISHCECDIRFHSCLHEKPYKEYSSTIWSSYESIEVKCFAYLPCSEENKSNYDNIWSKKDHRRIGTCYQNLRVILFDSIFDYKVFINQTLTHVQHKEVYDLLNEKMDMFLSSKKKMMKCFKMFDDYPKRIVSYYYQNFLIQFKNNQNSSTKKIISSYQSTSENDNIENLKNTYIQIYTLIVISVLTLILIGFGLFKLISSFKKNMKLTRNKESQKEPLL